MEPMIEKELIVKLGAKPEELSRVTDILGRQNVNLNGFSVQRVGKESMAHFVTSDPSKAITALKQAGLQTEEREILSLNVPNKPGAFAGVTKRLQESGVNIEAAFPTTDKTGKQVGIAVCCDDVPSARKALADLPTE